MFCPRCGILSASDAGPCTRCGASMARPQPAQGRAEPPVVRAPTNRGEREQRAAGILARSLPKAPARPRPEPPSPAAAPPPVAPAAPEHRPGPSPPAAVPSWPPPPAQWEPRGAGAWAPPSPGTAAPPPPGWPPANVWPPPPPEPARGGEQTSQWAPPRPRTGWARPSGAWWDRLLGAPAGPAYAGTNPPTYFWQSLVCLFLFLPTGVAAVAYSLLVTRRAQVGDGEGSARASQLARLWCIVTLVVFAVALVLSAATGFKA